MSRNVFSVELSQAAQEAKRLQRMKESREAWEQQEYAFSFATSAYKWYAVVEKGKEKERTGTDLPRGGDLYQRDVQASAVVASRATRKRVARGVSRTGC